ncbi:uncharacterized protein LOC125750949 isoform X1 [Brienomyrus brachyistius]|uniref:uncharacterized protein LOC125750949 isoform X1 n=1 Tax=Brienomyrus brachyistius TaxID=42636 RepID=UPI0020B2F780|nr:uncharacterized protein LOC125750949 isoform X1 [Brienomyrus brachyistius]
MSKMIGLYIILVHFSELHLASDTVIQPSPFMTVEAGDDVTLECSFPKESAYFVFWFKLNFGQRPFLIAASHASRTQDTFNSNSTHYEVQQDGGMIQLIILKTEPADSGMYYCGTRKIVAIFFGAGTFLRIRGAEKQPIHRIVEQQPVSDTVQPGDSVSLQCTIETGSCAGEHSVYWFRHGSGESLPGVIYSHRNRSDECEKSPEAGSPTRSCVYSLPKGNLSSSDAGTYYCAVAMCGEMLFGNGTKIHIQEPCITVTIIMGSALVLCVTVIFTLACTRNRRTCCEHCAACESELEHLKDRKETDSQVNSQ